jgi:hypothetical protein
LFCVYHLFCSFMLVQTTAITSLAAPNHLLAPKIVA